MITIAPSILSSDFSQFAAAVTEFELAGADWIHFDVMDGQFVPPITFGHQLVADLRKRVALPFEVHLMTQTPDRHFDSFIKAGCKRVIFHLEATPHAHRLCQILQQQGIESGIALNPATPATTVVPLLSVVDLILVMTVNPGWGGQPLIDSCVQKVREIRAMTDLPIEVDGGIDDQTIAAVHAAGANTFVTGSYLARSDDRAEAIRRLRRACAP